MPFYRWDIDKEQILNRLRSKATLKICVKLLDEPLLIGGWIDHHAKIVGVENLIIADNGSTDPRTLDLYERFSHLATIFQFDGPHNEIHWHPRFADLFGVIRETCQYFSFIDADERLVLIRENIWIADSSIVTKIGHSPAVGIIPTTWLINTLNCLDTFDLLDTESRPRLENNLKWGKPILPSTLVGIQPGMHNVQFSHYVFSTEFGVDFFLLHYTQFPENRISVNRNKLISKGIVERSVSSQEIVRMDFHHRPDKSFMRFVNEIKDMFFVISQGAKEDHRRTQDYLRLGPAGDIYYSNDHVQRVLSEFLNSGRALIDRTFNIEPEEKRLRGTYSLSETLDGEPDDEKIDEASLMLARAVDLRQQGEGNRAQRLFRHGMVLHRDFLDKYGAPAFEKDSLECFWRKESGRKRTNFTQPPETPEERLGITF
jgi:hypothetical protein